MYCLNVYNIKLLESKTKCLYLFINFQPKCVISFYTTKWNCSLEEDRRSIHRRCPIYATKLNYETVSFTFKNYELHTRLYSTWSIQRCALNKLEYLRLTFIFQFHISVFDANCRAADSKLHLIFAVAIFSITLANCTERFPWANLLKNQK